MKILTALLITLFLASCASTEEKSETAVAEAKASSLSVYLTSHRHLSLEPCGCSVSPLGGVEREWNLLSQWQKQSGTKVFFSSGTSFVPLPHEVAKDKTDFYLEKARFMVNAMNELGTDAALVTAEDTFLGIEKLKLIEGDAKFPLVATNLFSKSSGKSLFKTHVEIERDGYSILVLGVTTQARKELPPALDVEVKAPLDSIRAVMGELPPKPRFVVLLSNLSPMERETLLSSLSEVHVLAGGASEETQYEPYQFRGATIVMAPLDRGRSVAGAKFTLRQPLTLFYNEDSAATYAEMRTAWAAKIQELDKQLAKKKMSYTARKNLETDKAKFSRMLSRTANIPLQEAANLSKFEVMSATLDKTFDGNTPLHSLVERYKDKLRSVALDKP